MLKFAGGQTKVESPEGKRMLLDTAATDWKLFKTKDLPMA